MSVRAMKAGAVDFLTKPFRDQDLLDAVTAAINKDADRRQQTSEIRAVECLIQSLTDREREVISAVANGLMNKQIAFNLGVREITVKLHRARVMKDAGDFLTRAGTKSWLDRERLELKGQLQTPETRVRGYAPIAKRYVQLAAPSRNSKRR